MQIAPWAEANYLGDCTGSSNDINNSGHGFRQTIDRARAPKAKRQLEDALNPIGNCPRNFNGDTVWKSIRSWKRSAKQTAQTHCPLAFARSAGCARNWPDRTPISHVGCCRLWRP